MSDTRLTPDKLTAKFNNDDAFSDLKSETQANMVEAYFSGNGHVERLACKTVWIEIEGHKRRGDSSEMTVTDILSEGEEVQDWCANNINFDSFMAIGAEESIEKYAEELRKEVYNRGLELWRATDPDELLALYEMEDEYLKAERDKLEARLSLINNELNYRDSC